MRLIATMLLLLLIASFGFSADIGSPIPIPGECCTEDDTAEYEVATVAAITAEQPMVTWVNSAPVTYQSTSAVMYQSSSPVMYQSTSAANNRRAGRFFRARAARLFGVDRPRLTVSRPYRGAMYWVADLDPNASASAIARALQMPIPGLGVAVPEARQGVTSPPVATLAGSPLVTYTYTTTPAYFGAPGSVCYTVNGKTYCR